MCCRAATGHKRTIPRFVFRRQSERLHLLTTARQMLAEQGPARPTMDGLAERAGLGKGAMFRRFGRN